MKCTPININGMHGFVCSRSRARAKPCSESSCGRLPSKECDFKLGGRRAGKTCDRPICDAHARPQGTHADGPHKGDSIDYCPAHDELAQKRPQEAAQPSEAPAAVSPTSEQGAFDFGDATETVRAS